MEVLKLVDYEKSEPGTGTENGSGAETKTSAVKHNGSTGLFKDAIPSRRPATTEPSSLMAENLLTPEQTNSREYMSSTSGHELDAFLGKAFKDESVWVGLWANIQDVFFPVKLPPLELTSKPIPVPDRMAVKANPVAIGISTAFNITIALLAIWLGLRVVDNIVHPPTQMTSIDVGDYKAPQASNKAGGGGGGGDRSVVEANKGKLPEKAPVTVTPPQPQTIEKPKLPDPSTINVQKNIQLPDNMNMPMVGMHDSTNITIASAGSGNGAGMGTGSGGGLGPGGGNGYGPGYGGNAGGGVYQVGGRISAPEVLHSVEAEFSDEARRAKYQGVCLISLIVDAQGNPQNIRVARTLGMGLDEKAIEAIRQYKFRPAMKDGKTAVPVAITIEVDFRLY